MGVPENPSLWRGRPRKSVRPKIMGDQVRGSQKGREARTGTSEAVGGSEDKVLWRWRPRELRPPKVLGAQRTPAQRVETQRELEPHTAEEGTQPTDWRPS